MVIKDKSQKGTLPENELKSLNEFVKSNYWRDAFKKMDLPILKRKEGWFTNCNKARYYINIPSLKNSVLDIGAGGGVISQELSKVFKQVYALEYNPRWLKFLSSRFRQDKINNIHIIRGNAIDLPFRKNSFDLVIVNGVLEWVADFSLDNSVKDIHKKFLREIVGIIRPGGKIAIAIENRFYLRWFLGQSPHGEPPFVAVLPRFMADFICRRLIKGNYRYHIYTYWGYKRLLREAGLKNINIQLALPSYYTPEFIVSLDKKSLTNYYDKLSILTSNKPVQKIVKALLLNLGVLGFIEHSFYISAEKS